MLIPETQRHLAVPIDSVRRLPIEENPRRGDKPALKESLDENQQFKPIVVNVRIGTRYGDRTVLAGNHTHEVAEEMGETEIAVVFVDVDDEKAWKIILADNRQGDLGYYDPELILTGLERAGGTKGTGYDDEWVKAAHTAMTPPEEFTEYDEDAADKVRMTTCPNCQHEFPV